MNDKTAYPLYWPAGRARCASRKVGRFKVTFAIARDHCAEEIERIGGRDGVISTNIELKANGEPYAVAFGRLIPDPGVVVYFKRNGKELCFACDCYHHVQDNMQAIALTIHALRGIARWGTGDMMEAAFRGFTALPERAGSNWWETLGVAVNASEEQVKDAYRLLAKKHHPDTGGDSELFRRVQEAYQAFQKLQSA